MKYSLNIILAFASLCLNLIYINGDLINNKLNDYTLWCIGNCDKDISTETTPGVVMMGGGTDTDEAFVWHINRANKGDFVVIRTSGDDAYNNYIYALSVASKAKLNSVTTILFKRPSASSESVVLEALNNAEAIFLAGGDQSDYLDYWNDTEVQSVIQNKMSNITIGGTSAGCMVLSSWIYSASKGSVDSSEALANPYNKYMTLTTSFLTIPFLDSIILDTHFVTRDRMGRTLTFMARILTDYVDFLPSDGIVRGVGIDEHTALLMDYSSGDIEIVGVGTAYVCSADLNSYKLCKSGQALTFEGVSCTRLNALLSDLYSFKSFSGDGVVYESEVQSGVITTDAYGPGLTL